MKYILSLILFSAIFSCSSSRKGGCSKPKKTYARDLEAKVKLGVDSISLLPKQNLELGLKQTITRLTDYTSEGLDLDLILYRVCENAVNLGYTAEQSVMLQSKVIDAWKEATAAKKKVNQ